MVKFKVVGKFYLSEDFIEDKVRNRIFFQKVLLGLEVVMLKDATFFPTASQNVRKTANRKIDVTLLFTQFANHEFW